jgi:hypothetical protein
MQKTKKQHYVPQFYLRRFAAENGELFVFDKFTGKVFQSNVKDVAQERYFYDFPEDIAGKDIDVQWVEKTLASMESKFSAVISQLLATKSKKIISRRQKQALSLFVPIQSLRTRDFRNESVELIEKATQAMLEAFSEHETDFNPDEYRVKFDEKLAPVWHGEFMLNPATLNPLMAILNNHIWLIGLNQSKKPFYTSDNPIARNAHASHPIKSMRGLGSVGIEIAFPLTPNHILILCEKTAFKQYEKQDGKILPLKEENVTYYNDLQVTDSYRWIYSSINDFGLVQEICKERPHVCSPNREKVEIVGKKRPAF